MNPATMQNAPRSAMAQSLSKKLKNLDQMPTIPAVLLPLMRYLERPVEQIELQQVVSLISQDESLVTKCLSMANSPLFGRSKEVDTIHGAVIALGMQRMRDIAVSCSVLNLMPNKAANFNPTAFWEHSLGCALVCREFARKIRYPDPGKAYLAGLLHDVGIVAHLWIVPQEFQSAVQNAQTQGIALHEAEAVVLGTDHCETGSIVGARWHLTSDLLAVIGSHHAVAGATSHRDLVALVSLSDLLCRMSGLGYGYPEAREVSFIEEPGFSVLLQECPALLDFDWARFTFELEAYMEEVHRLVGAFYRNPN
ncbi:MAG: HDOD domain-containing protein [Terriglobales bacterium]|jgi:HD-like signal output (HDOD) protein